MPKRNTQKEILQKALAVFEKTTQVTAELEALERTFDTVDRADAVIRIVWQDMEWHFAAEVKATLAPATLGAAVHQLYRFPEKGILVTRYVTPQIAERLKEMDIPFIDTAGNAYLNEPPLFIYIKGNRPDPLFHPARPPRAFQPTGLQVVFALLCNPGLEDAPFREIKKLAQVALGTVGWVMRDLRGKGYLLDIGKRGRRLVQKKDLLTQWVTTYPQLLRPKLVVGRFRTTEVDWWKRATLRDLQAFWGGEIAAAMLTRYLKPHIVTIYTKQPLGRLMVPHKIKKDDGGDIEVLNVFWDFEFEWPHRELVHPILIYADLLATGDPRNIEMAKMIYEQELTRLVRED